MLKSAINKCITWCIKINEAYKLNHIINTCGRHRVHHALADLSISAATPPARNPVWTEFGVPNSTRIITDR